MGLPIVFLPGIMGSRLRFPESGLFWDPDSTLRMLRWIAIPVVNPADVLARKIHRDAPAEVLEDESNGLLDDQVDRGWSGVAKSFYVTLLQALQNNGDAKVYAVGYDWRQDLVALSPYLRDRLAVVRQRENGAKVILITHSMGGLLARSALRQNPDLVETVAGVIHIFQPVQGAVVLYRRFFTGVRVGPDERITEFPLIWIFGDNAQHFATNVCGMPGAMQLLPTADYQFPPGSRFIPFTEPADLYELYADLASPPGLTPAGASEYVRINLVQRWAEVRAFHELVRGFRHPNTWALFGTKLATDMAVGFDGATVRLVRPEAGDGTVPGPSGGGLFDEAPTPVGPDLDPAAARQWVVQKVEHSAACRNLEVQAAVQKVVDHINTLAAATV